MGKSVPAGKLYRWSLKLQPYNFQIKHRKGLLNQNSDALSRIDYSNYTQTEREERAEQVRNANVLTCTEVEKKFLSNASNSSRTGCSAQKQACCQYQCQFE